MDDAIAFCVIVMFIVYLRERVQREFIPRGKLITCDNIMAACRHVCRLGDLVCRFCDVSKIVETCGIN